MSGALDEIRTELANIAGAVQGVFAGHEVVVNRSGTVMRGEPALPRLREEREAVRDRLLVHLVATVDSIDQQLADLGRAVQEEAVGTASERLAGFSDRDLVIELARRAQVRVQELE